MTRKSSNGWTGSLSSRRADTTAAAREKAHDGMKPHIFIIYDNAEEAALEYFPAASSALSCAVSAHTSPRLHPYTHTVEPPLIRHIRPIWTSPYTPRDSLSLCCCPRTRIPPCSCCARRVPWSMNTCLRRRTPPPCSCPCIRPQ